MKEMCYKLHTNEQAMDSVETVSMQSVLTDGRGAKEQNKAGSVTTNTEEDIRDGSIAKSG